ncbi:hypothetical protein [Streptomyces oceani]|uniref:Uncharacterized protein n=1 Tax=Streptomyces oceani TaxID=1075402 RepID=A0A1E7JZH0_9ACTN|nr:hypothetical protein AN216_17535 [Streptomyces oceani]
MLAVSSAPGLVGERLVVTARPARVASESQPEASGIHTGTPRPYCSVMGRSPVRTRADRRTGGGFRGAVSAVCQRCARRFEQPTVPYPLQVDLLERGA